MCLGDKGLFLSSGTSFRLNIISWSRYYHRINVIGIETRVLRTGMLRLQASAVHLTISARSGPKRSPLLSLKHIYSLTSVFDSSLLPVEV